MSEHEFKVGEWAWSPFYGWAICKFYGDTYHKILLGENSFTATGRLYTHDKFPTLQTVQERARLGDYPPGYTGCPYRDLDEDYHQHHLESDHLCRGIIKMPEPKKLEKKWVKETQWFVLDGDPKRGIILVSSEEFAKVICYEVPGSSYFSLEVTKLVKS